MTLVHRLTAFVICLVLSMFCLTASVLAQSATAVLSGTVEDQHGAVIPGALVTVENVNTNLRRQVTTNGDGSFTFPLLPPSSYVIRVEIQGFSPVEVRNVVLNVGDQKALQIELKAGDVNATVQVV